MNEASSLLTYQRGILLHSDATAPLTAAAAYFALLICFTGRMQPNIFCKLAADLVHLYTANADSQLQDPVGLFHNVAVRYKIYSTAKGVSIAFGGGSAM